MCEKLVQSGILEVRGFIANVAWWGKRGRIDSTPGDRYHGAFPIFLSAFCQSKAAERCRLRSVVLAIEVLCTRRLVL